VQLTTDLFRWGGTPGTDVVQARTQLEDARVQDTDIGVLRAQYEHAVAVLIGKPPADFGLRPAPLSLGRSDHPGRNSFAASGAASRHHQRCVFTESRGKCTRWSMQACEGQFYLVNSADFLRLTVIALLNVTAMLTQGMRG
jgi:hypothetical protein